MVDWKHRGKLWQLPFFQALQSFRTDLFEAHAPVLLSCRTDWETLAALIDEKKRILHLLTEHARYGLHVVPNAVPMHALRKLCQTIAKEIARM